jgi:pimeloyl-ACP methyl ester carboxylesterase
VVTFPFGFSLPADRYDNRVHDLHDFILEVDARALIGISGGGSVAVNGRRRWPEQIACAVDISGRLIPAFGGIWPDPRHPLFEQAVEEVAAHPLPGGVLTYGPLGDWLIVPPQAIAGEGADNRQVPTRGHMRSILWALYRRDKEIVQFIKEHQAS